MSEAKSGTNLAVHAFRYAPYELLADAGNRRDHALFPHGGALRHFQQGRRTEPPDSGEGRGDPPFAFEDQDAPVIEAQQRIIDAAQTSVDPLTLAIDVGPVRYKQVLKKLIAAEQAP